MTVEAEREPDFRLEAERELVETCDRILAPTLRERDHLIRYYGAHPESIGVVPCGVNLALFRPMDKARARQQLGFSPEETVVLFVGRFAPLKGIERLLAAATYLHEPRRLRLVIIGGNGDRTPESQRVRRFSEVYGIEEAVTLTGRVAQKQLPPYYSAADVLVIPSYYESFGLVALESLACGTPVVATEVGAMPSILCEGVNGCVVRDGSPRALARGIDRVLGSARLFSGEIIRGSVLRFAWKQVAAAMIDEYNILLRSRRGDSGSVGTVSQMALGGCARASTGRG
jgi:D-inositol-3-phosphate glycosyltransferase